MGSIWALGVDVGGTRICAGLMSDAGRVRGLVEEHTPRAEGAWEVLARLLEVADHALEKGMGEGAEAPQALGIGFGGPVDFDAGLPRMSHHVEGWGGVDIAGAFRERFGLPTVLENDANAGGFGEALFGAARGLDPVLYVNIGTGVGGAVIIDGNIHHGAHGNAGEFGHMVIDPAGPPCTCDKRGCVESFCSGDALGRDANALLEAGTVFGGIHRDGIRGSEVGALAKQGDPEALRLVEASADRMGFALAFSANLLDPAVIVLGGGVPEMGDTYLNPVRQAFLRYAMEIPAARTEIRGARFGHDAGVVGAAAVALRELGAI